MPIFMRRIALLIAALLIFVTLPAPGDAQSAADVAVINGTIVDQDGGTQISGATVTLYQGSSQVATTKSRSNGTFSITVPTSGSFFLVYELAGYRSVRSDDILVSAGSTTNVRAVMARAPTATTQSLREIGRVSSSATTGNGSLATSTTISQTLSSELLQKQGYVRIGDALQTLPGVNLQGLSSSIGDTINVDIRGVGTSETQSLLDGHPIGPQGVGGNVFDYQVSPGYGIANTVVTYGSGALGLYGTDSIGGTVDMQSLSPTRENHFSLTQGIGYLGRHFTDLEATGSLFNGKLGYALATAQDGTYGPWPTQARVQPGLFGGNFSPDNVGLNTYGTSGTYSLRNDLFKLRYNINNTTSFTATAFNGDSFDDKSGNGDNCYFTEGLQLFRAQASATANGAQPNLFIINDTSGNQIQATQYPNGVPCPVNTVGASVNNKTVTCLNPFDYARRSWGLAGGGPGPFQAHRFNDYHGRIQTTVAGNTITLDGFGNRYSTDYNRNVNGGSFNTDFYDTTGLLISDDIARPTNDFGFGYYVEHQNHIGDFLQTQGDLAGQILFGANSTPGQQYSLGNRNFFVRDQYTPPGPLSIFLNAWLKRSTVTQKQTLDPRLSFVFRPSSRDAIRLSGGRSDGQPSPDLLFGPPAFNLTPSNVTPTCGPGGLTAVGNSQNPDLLQETSTEAELGYGHRFNGDTVINIDAYYSFEKNRIFSGLVPISSIPQTQVPPDLLAQYLTRINAFCGTTTASAAQLAFSANFNAAASRYQGVELSGRYRLNRVLFVDYTYNIQSAVNLGIPDNVLMNNVTFINGSQIQGVALQKASAGLDYADRHGFEARVDSYYIGSFNEYHRYPFFYANASFSKKLTPNLTFNIGVQNLFDSQASQILSYGEAQPFQGENRFGTDQSTIQQISSQNIGQTGLLPITAVFSLSAHI